MCFTVGMGVITCGVFRANEVRPHEWEFTCKHLPGWTHLVIGTKDVAMDALIRIQAEFRDTWAEAVA